MLSNRSAVCLVNNFQKLSLRPIQTTSILNAAPMKKKRTDASLVLIKIERKKRKFERLVQELSARDRIKIPLTEYTVDKQILKNLDDRKRKNEEKLKEIKNELERLNAIWLLYKGLENHFDNYRLKLVLQTRLNALKALQKVSLKLYENALLVDETLFPFKDERIVKETVANKDFKPNDGQVVDVTKVWEIKI